MSDRDSTGPPSVTFDEAVRNVVQGLRDSVIQFEELLREVPEEAYTEGEWRVIERTAGEIESLVEQAELDYEMAAYDSAAWYEIMRDVPRVTARLGEAILLMHEAQARHTRHRPPPSEIP